MSKMTAKQAEKRVSEIEKELREIYMEFPDESLIMIRSSLSQSSDIKPGGKIIAKTFVGSIASIVPIVTGVMKVDDTVAQIVLMSNKFYQFLDKTGLGTIVDDSSTEELVKALEFLRQSKDVVN